MRYAGSPPYNLLVADIPSYKTTGSIGARDGTHLSYARWAPPTVRAALVIAHGLGEHGGRYAHVAQHLNAQGYDVWALDHRGHGASGGARGVIAQPDDLVVDLHMMMQHVRAQTGALPFLLGHSLGGLVAAAYATHRTGEMRGLVLSSAAIKLWAGGGQRALARMLNRLAPAMTLPNGLKVQAISHDPATVAGYQADPLVHSKISARLANWMFEESQYVRQNAHRVVMPTLVMWAGNDKLVDPSGSELFFKRLPEALREARPYPLLFHEIFNETADARAKVLNDLSDWLNRH